ncbi:MAG: hypothetical protein JO278_02985, partial [Dyella sp.]|nr:hypothetical protein [Dyella sp.]
MTATSFSLLLLAALLGVAAAVGVRSVKAEGGSWRKAAWSTAWPAILMSHATLGMPLWVALASGTLTAANDGAQLAATFAATMAATLAASQLFGPPFQWLRQGMRGWRVAVAVAMLAGAGLVAVAGARLGRACGTATMTARACIDAADMSGAAWLAAGLGLLCAALFAMNRAQSRGWAQGAAEPAHADDVTDEHATLPAFRTGDGRPVRRGPSRIPGLTIRQTNGGQQAVGEYSVSTDPPDRTAFARWLDQSIASARLTETGCAVLLIHIADYREVDEVFEVRA